jgi:deoxyribodipyrimidine photo-lyase
MQANRRLASNHSLDYAVQLAKELGKELVIYEGLRKDYPWNSKRLHQFILEGMIDNAKEAERISANYWSYVETPKNPAQGLLKKIAENAVSIITDDFPCFIIPEQIENLSKKEYNEFSIFIKTFSKSNKSLSVDKELSSFCSICSCCCDF